MANFPVLGEKRVMIHPVRRSLPENHKMRTKLRSDLSAADNTFKKSMIEHQQNVWKIEKTLKKIESEKELISDWRTRHTRVVKEADKIDPACRYGFSDNCRGFPCVHPNYYHTLGFRPGYDIWQWDTLHKEPRSIDSASLRAKENRYGKSSLSIQEMIFRREKMLEKGFGKKKRDNLLTKPIPRAINYGRFHNRNRVRSIILPPVKKSEEFVI